MTSYQFENLTVNIEQQDDVATYSFVGEMTERFEFKNMQMTSCPKIVFDMSQVRSFNSCGIREWVFFMKEFENVDSLTFEKCSISTIDQFNMVPATLGIGIVESFYAPYYCEGEDKPLEKLIHITASANDLSQGQAPVLKCDSCDMELIFDAIEESYFVFITGALSRSA